MAQMNISLPKGLKEWAESRVTQGLYSSTSDFVRDLMRRDMEHEERVTWLRAEIRAGLDSPIVDDTLDDIIEEGFRRVA
jgi:antitoxin ParD1/3/4